MKVIKGEKYLCKNGPKKAMIFRVVAFTQFHIVCENLSQPSSDVEMILKYYFLNSFIPYNHRESVKLDDIEIQQIMFSINNKIKQYVEEGAMSDSLFRLIAADVGQVLMSEFREER